MPAADKVNILIVDDLPDKLLVLESILETLGQRIVKARSGEEALRRVLEQEFAVILLDVNMPGMDGFETATLIRRRKKSAHTPIIFITAFADEIQSTTGYSLGAVDYILTPVVPEVLRTKVSVFVDLFQMAQQVRRQAEERIALAEEQAARSAAEEATRRSAFLAEASKVLGSSLDPRATLRELAHLAVPTLADLAVTAGIDESGPFEVADVACLSTDGAVTRGEWRVSADEHAGGMFPQTIESGGPHAAPILFARAIDAVVRALSAAGKTMNGQAKFEKDHSNLLSAIVPEPCTLSTASEGCLLLVLPLLARGRMLGVLALARNASRPLGAADRALAEDLVSRAAIALDNSRLYQNIQENDRRKDEFLAMLAHELRNPLAPVRNAVEILRRLGTDHADSSSVLDMINRQIAYMTRLIEDLLDVSRLSRGKIQLRKERLDLVALVRTTAEDYRATLAQSGLNLQIELPEEPISVEGDATRLAQVVGNALQNAHKFTDTGGRIWVRLQSCIPHGTATLTIRDTGIGMEKDMLRRAFEAFSQADRSLDRTRGGLGLGLTLVKGLIEMHGGVVGIASEGPGKGTILTIKLPECSLPPISPARPISREGAPCRILIVEDRRDTAESLRKLLTLTGHEVKIALTGPDGIKAAGEFQPDVVLCDIGLPGMDGYAVARALRSAPNGPAVLIAISGYGQAEDQRQAREAGFDAHLTKPVEFKELQELLASLSGGKQHSQLG